MKRSYVVILMVCLLVFSVFSTSLFADQQKEKYLIGLSQDTLDQPWRAGMVQDALNEAKKYADKIEVIVTDGQGSSSKQINDIEDLVSRGIDILLMSPHEAQPLARIVSEVYKSGIPVIVLDREVETEDYTCFIGASNIEIGKQAGKFIVDYLKGKGNIVELEGIPGASPTRDRSEPVHEILSQYPDIKIVAQQPADYEESKALEVMENILQAHPRGTIDLVYCHSDTMALGAIKTMKAADRMEIAVVGCDAQKQALEAIMRGEMLATFTYPFPGAMGIQTALKILGGEEVPKRITLPTTLITKDNVKEFYDPNALF